MYILFHSDEVFKVIKKKDFFFNYHKKYCNVYITKKNVYYLVEYIFIPYTTMW